MSSQITADINKTPLIAAKSRYNLLIIVLGALTALGPFSIDMYLPGFPAIAESFGVSTDKVTMSLSSFFLGIALGQVVYGPLLDRYGRKKPLYAGLALYLSATAGCYYASSIEMLIALRFVQAVGSCAAGVVSMTLVRDLFPIKDSTKIFSLLLLVLGASPMVAPTIGSFVSAAFGWQSIFAALFLIAVIILIAAYLLLPETHRPDTTYTLRARSVLITYRQVLKNHQFLVYAVGGGIASAGMFAYIAASPTIFMSGYGVSGRVYGWLFAGITIGFISLSQLNRIFSKYFGAAQIVLGAAIVMALASSLLLYGLNHQWFGIGGTAVMLFIFLGCVGIINPNAASLSMAPFEKGTGYAASLFGLIQWGIAGLTAVVVALFKNTTPIPLTVIMIATAIVALLIFYRGSRLAVHISSLKN